MANLQLFTDFNIQTQLTAERETARALAILASAGTVTSIATGTGDEAAVAATTGLRLMGFAAYETAGSNAGTVIIRIGTSNSGVPVGGCVLAASGVFAFTFPAGGIPADAGVWIERTGTGSTAVSVITKTVAVT